MERVVADALRYELVGEDGEPVGDFSSAEDVWSVGDLVPCGARTFEIVHVDGSTLQVRKVL